jgi:hypothetical protein
MALYSPPKSKRSAADIFDPALRNPRSELRIRLVDGQNWHEKEDASRLIVEGEQDPSTFSTSSIQVISYSHTLKKPPK